MNWGSCTGRLTWYKHWRCPTISSSILLAVAILPPSSKGWDSASLQNGPGSFGYGDPTGIDLPGEVGAIVPNDQWKRQLYAESWTTGDSYNMAIGQGYVLATPLQVLVSATAVANGGTVYEPRWFAKS